MHRKQISIVAVLLVVCLLAGCGASSKASDTVYRTEAASDMNSSAYVTEDVAEVEMGSGANSIGEDLVGVVEGRKIIRNANLTVETKDFDDFSSTLNSLIAELGAMSSPPLREPPDGRGSGMRTSPCGFRLKS